MFSFLYASAAGHAYSEVKYVQHVEVDHQKDTSTFTNFVNCVTRCHLYVTTLTT